MKLTRERKILFGLLAVGGAALLIDRLSGGGAPAPAAAETVEMPAKPAAAANAVAARRGVAESKSRLSARIAGLDQADEGGGEGMAAYRDPFHISSTWGAAVEAREAAPARHEPPPPDFDQVHHLTAVIVSGRQSAAVVDGSLLKVGQTVAGHTLIAVTQDMAIFDHQGNRVLLRLEMGQKPDSIAR